MAFIKPITDLKDLPVTMDLALAGRFLGYTDGYLQKLARRGAFPAYQIAERGQWRVDKSDLFIWQAQRKEVAKTKAAARKAV